MNTTLDLDDPMPRKEAELREMTGYTRWFFAMAKRAGYKHEYPAGRSTIGHWMKWLRENPEFRPSDYRQERFVRCPERRPKGKSAIATK